MKIKSPMAKRHVRNLIMFHFNFTTDYIAFGEKHFRKKMFVISTRDII